MEIFFMIIPFLVPLSILIYLYNTYKNKKKIQENKIEKPASKLNKYAWYRYIRLVFMTRVWYRQSTAIWFVPLGFSFVFGMVTLYINLTHLIYPPLPLEKMITEKGIIKSIIIRKKMRDLLIFTTENGKDKRFGYSAFTGEVDTLPNQSVKVWYAKGMSSAYTVDNIIYEITRDGKTIRESPYDYEHRLEIRKSTWSFVKYCLYISLFSLSMIWIGNRKELPIHRLGRIKFNKRKKEQANGN